MENKSERIKIRKDAPQTNIKTINADHYYIVDSVKEGEIFLTISEIMPSPLNTYSATVTDENIHIVSPEKIPNDFNYVPRVVLRMRPEGAKVIIELLKGSVKRVKGE